jgi:hypothetical protein
MALSAVRRQLTILLGIATCAVLLIPAAARAGGPPAAATLPGTYCDGTRARVFQPWGDLSYYARLENGGFENGSGPWTLRGGASVVSGNEPFFISGNQNDSHSLLLPSGSTAYSGFMCFAIADWHVRFVMRNVGASSGALRIQVVVPDPIIGFLTVLDGGTVSGSGTWAPSPRILLPLTNVAWLIGNRAVAFRFTPVGRNAAYQIDDGYLDPWKST